MNKFKLDNIDKFINALEEMMDARDDMWQEEHYCNYRQMNDIKYKRYLPAKELLKESLYDFIAEVMSEESGSESA